MKPAGHPPHSIPQVPPQKHTLYLPGWRGDAHRDRTPIDDPPLGSSGGWSPRPAVPLRCPPHPTLRAPPLNSRTQQRHLSAHSSPTRAVTRWQAARTPFSAGLRAYPTSCGKVERSGRVWIRTAVCDRLGTNLYSIFKGVSEERIKQQRSSPKRRSYSSHLKRASSNQHIVIERPWYALALF